MDVASLGIQVDSKSASVAVTDLDQLTAAAGRVEGATKSLTTSMQRAANDFAGVSQQSKSAALSAQAFTDSLGNEASAFERLRASVDPLYAASKKYEEVVRETDIALKLGIATQSQANAVIAAAGQRYLALDDVTTRVGATTSGFSHHAKYAAFQLSQVGQQTMATGNFMQALAIQLPDLGLAFGAVGAAVGLLAGIGLPLLYKAFTDGQAAVLSYEDSLEGLIDATDSLNEIAAVYSSEGLQTLVDKYGEVDAAVLSLIQRQKELAANTAMQSAKSAAEALSAEFDSVFRTRPALIADMLGIELSFAEATTRAGYLNEQVGLFENTLVDIRTADTFGEQADAIAVMLTILEDAGQQNTELYRQLVSNEDQLRQMAAAAPEASWMNSAIDGVMSLGEAVRARISEVLALKAQASADLEARPYSAQQYLDQQYMEYSGRGADPRIFMNGNPGATSNISTRTRSSGGGGRSEDDFAKKMEKLKEELATEAETVNNWYAEQEALLNDRRAIEMLGETEHKNALLRLEQEYQDRMNEAQGGGLQSRLGQMADFWGGIATIAAAGGQKTARVVAAAEAIQGTINAYGAAVKALNTPGLTIWGRFAAYASVLGAGLKGVAAIRQAGSGSSSISAGVSTPTISALSSVAAPTTSQGSNTPAATEAVREVEFVVKGINDGAVMSGKMFKDIFDGILSEADLRGVKVVWK